MIESDWIKLLVKFRGKCSSCGKFIKPGDYAFWSKISKSIKHLDCYYDYRKTLENKKIFKPSSSKVECILCKSSHFLLKDIGYDDEDVIQQDPYIICHTCIKNSDCYNRYQHYISEKMKRIVRLKS
jgi:hypothetical protein